MTRRKPNTPDEKHFFAEYPPIEEPAWTPPSSGMHCPRCQSERVHRAEFRERQFVPSWSKTGFPINKLITETVSHWACLDCWHRWD